jgi:ribosomal-protein-alanine N-acetyltransferase
MSPIRSFRVQDMERVIAICDVSFKERYSEDFLLSCFENAPELFLVAEDGRGEALGLALGVRQHEALGRILILAVDPRFRRRGIGEGLMRALLWFFSSMGVYEVRLEVRVSNNAALALYRKLGFRIVGRTRGYYADGEDAYILNRSLLRVSIFD